MASRLYSVLEAGLGSGAGLTECLTRLLGEAESSLLSHCQVEITVAIRYGDMCIVDYTM